MPKRERQTVLIAATSGRALAQSAARAGMLPLTADFFRDLDTAAAGESALVSGAFAIGFERTAITRALRRLAQGRKPLGVIYGSGFEADVAALEAVGDEFRLLGNPPEVVARLKDPLDFANTCKRLGIPHPHTQLEPPAVPDGWLRKQRGGSGGSHIAAAKECCIGPGDYFQRQASGTPISALFLGNGTQTAIIGFSQQWSAPTENQPLRYGGAIRPAQISPALSARLKAAVGLIAASYGLRGLNSADFVTSEDDHWLLEINPRPGATVDIFDDDAGWLVKAHIASSSGELPASVPVSTNFGAATIVYADHAIAAVPEIVWPDWALDRQAPGTRVETAWPLCTVVAFAETRSRTMGLLATREKEMKCLLGGMPA